MMRMNCILLAVTGLLLFSFGYSVAQNCSATCEPPMSYNDTEICNVTSGECLHGCVQGYSGFNCSVECPEQCASPKQNDTYFCNDTTLACTSGCNVGFSGQLCDVKCPENCILPVINGSDTCNSTTEQCLLGCKVGYTGHNCSIECPSNCLLPLDQAMDVCSASTLECTFGCEQGFAGPMCMYNCSQQCALPEQNDTAVCYSDTGNCTLGCKPGYSGSNCSTQCPENCDLSTNIFNETCNDTSLQCFTGCKPGYMGLTCSEACPSNCGLPTNECDEMTGACLYGCDAGYAGENCSYTCPQNCFISPLNDTDTCNTTDGECNYGCVKGYTGPDCSITCPDNCGTPTGPNNGTCDADTGQCLFGCAYSYTGENCSDTCPDNCARFAEGGPQITCNETSHECTNGCDIKFTGSHCNESCPNFCDRCDDSSTCTECKSGFYINRGACIVCNWQCIASSDPSLPTCRQSDGRCEFGCRTGFYGQRCNEGCSSTCKNSKCDRFGGRCTDGCVSTEYQGLTCNGLCNDGCLNNQCEQNGTCLFGCDPEYWDDACDKSCNKNCLNGAGNLCYRSNGTCIYGCNGDKFWDSQCTEKCSDHCKDGTCEQMSGTCLSGCVSDLVYGSACDKRCSVGCRNGTCEPTSGTCLNGCSSDRVYGPGCDQQCSVNCKYELCDPDGKCAQGCVDRQYGDQCDKQCAAKCIGDTCAREDGRCTLGCERGYHGIHCTEVCPVNCANKTCNIDSGNCTFGCIFGTEGPRCESVVKYTPAPPVVFDKLWIYVGLGIGGAMVLGIIIIIVLVARRRKIIIERRRLTMNYENLDIGDGGADQVQRREHKKKKSTAARITQMLVENPLALLMRGANTQRTEADFGANTTIAVDDLLELVIQAEDDGGNQEFENLKSGLLKPHEESRKLENLALNFFGGIYPYDENRVVLGHGKHKEDFGEQQHGIMKSNTGRQGQTKSVHFPSFGIGSRRSDMKEKQAEDNGGLIVNDDLSMQRDRSDSNGINPTVLFSKTNVNDSAEGYTEINLVRQASQQEPRPSDHKREYINASYIKGYSGKTEYIAAQAPAKPTMTDFWMMVWEQQSPIIVMLAATDDEENAKCEKYWPEPGDVRSFGNFVVECTSCEVYAIHTERALVVKNELAGDMVNVIHYQFTDWPDRGCPASAVSVIEFHQRYKQLRKGTLESNPVIVHCTAGIGRTGVFIGLDFLYDEGKATGYVNVYKCVEKLRQQRVDMIPSSVQYDFLYKALAQTFALNCELVDCTSLPDILEDLKKHDIERGGKTKIEYLFQNLRDSLKLDTSEIAAMDRAQERMGKFRPTSDIPEILYRVDLPYGINVNAVKIDSFRYRNCLVAAQMPTPDTLEDFCQLLLHQNCGVVVMLNNLDPNDKTLGYYWPKQKKSLSVGNMKITTLEEDKKSDIDFVTRKLKFEVKEENKFHEVTVIQYTGWKIVKNVPSEKNLLKLIMLCRKYFQPAPDQRLLVHCMNGSEQSGLFCALFNICERLDKVDKLSIQCVVRAVLARLPASIPTVDQLEACFCTASSYLAQSESASDSKK